MFQIVVAICLAPIVTMAVGLTIGVIIGTIKAVKDTFSK